AYPVKQDVKLETDLKELGVSFFLERRELGAINVGGPGTIIVDGTEYDLNTKDCLFVGMGSKEVIFRSKDASKPAKFYLNSAPAHKEFPTAKTTLGEADSSALGSIQNSNDRTIHRFIHADGIQSSQLVMGMTQLKTG